MQWKTAMSAWFACVTFLLGGVPLARGSTPPFLMFTAAPQELHPVVDQHVRPGDYLNVSIVMNDSQLRELAGELHVYKLVPSLAAARTACAGDVKLVMYDGEHWASTPSDEQADMPGAIARGKQAVKSSGCRYGITPDGQYIGLVPGSCAYDAGRAIQRQVDWDDIDVFNIQAQRLLSKRCIAQGGIQRYVDFVTTIAAEVRAKNPNTKISAQFSLRMTRPEDIADAVHRLRGVVDGFYIAYPSALGSCAYCSPDNLARVLDAVRSSS